MFLKHLKLTNFRSFTQCDFNFQTPVTILVGDNAQGKTNFLESIYFLATTKSDRADKEEELIRYGEDFLKVAGVILETQSEAWRIPESSKDKDSGQARLPDGQARTTVRDQKSGVNLEIAMQLMNEHLSAGRHGLKKRVKVNGISRRVIDYSGNLAVVMFAPVDINLVTGSPSLRRQHVDQVLSQVDRDYKKALINYEEVVLRKNRVLKAIREKLASIDQLIFWSQQQLILAQVISQKRHHFFAFLNQVEKKFGQFRFEFHESEVSRERLQDYQDKEVEAAASLIGPHRDDFFFVILDPDRGRDLSRFGSRGEQRTAVLDLKMAEVAFIEAFLGDRPVLLLDDIFSELDLEHRKHVADLAKLQQTIITSVEEDGFLNKAFTGAKILAVANGQLALKADK